MTVIKLHTVLLLLLVFTKLQSQPITIPKSNAVVANYEAIIRQEKVFETDTLALKKYLKPLSVSNNKAHQVLYHALLANGFQNYHDRMTPISDSLYRKSIQLATTKKHLPLLIWSQINYVDALYKYRHYQNMLPILLEVLENMHHVSEDELILPGHTYKSIGWVLLSLSDYDEASDYLKRALKHTPPNTSEYAAILDNIGVVYYKTGYLEHALMYFDRAETIALKIGDAVRYAKVMGNTALVYYARKDYPTAIKLLQKDIAISEENSTHQNTMFAATNLCRVYLASNRFDGAKNMLLKAERIATSKSYYGKSELEILEIKLQLLEFQKNDIEELKTRKRMAVLNDSLSKTDGAEQINQSRWLIQKSKFQQKINETHTHYQEALLMKNKYIILAILVIIFAASLYFLQKYSLKKKKLTYEKKVKALQEAKIKIEKELLVTHKDFQQQSAYLEEKRLRMKALRKEIETIKSASASHLEEQKGKFLTLQDSNLMTQSNWTIFKQDFAKEHPDFFEKLVINFPELTDSNLRIILLQKLGFSKNEIANLLGITPDAIKKSKQRLKKKLGKKYASLLDFIQKTDTETILSTK